MNIRHTTLADCHDARGVVVVVDVLRAFTTTAFAFSQGAEEIHLDSTVDEAFAMKDSDPELLLAGEVDGYPIDGFDLPNSPAAMLNHNLTGRRLAMRTTAGTQGVVRSNEADHLFVAALTNASATTRAIEDLVPDQVAFVNTGIRVNGGEEDVACSEFIEAMLKGETPDPEAAMEQVRNARAAIKFHEHDGSDFPTADLELALQVDRFDFAMSVVREQGRLVLFKAK